MNVLLTSCGLETDVIEQIRLGNKQAIVFENDDLVIIE